MCRKYLPEKELAIKIRQVDPVKVNDCNIFDTRHGEVFEDFTAKTSCSNDEHFCILTK